MVLKRHLLVAEVETMERALQLGNAYFQANSTYRPGAVVQQVEANDGVSPSSAMAAVHMATAAADKPTSLTTSLVQELLAEIKRLRRQSVVEQHTRSPTTAVGRRTPFYWSCRSGGNLLRSCHHGGKKQLNNNGPK